MIFYYFMLLRNTNEYLIKKLITSSFTLLSLAKVHYCICLFKSLTKKELDAELSKSDSGVYITSRSHAYGCTAKLMCSLCTHKIHAY